MHAILSFGGHSLTLRRTRARSPTRYGYHDLRLRQARTRIEIEDGVDNVNQAIGVIPGKEGGVTLLVKKADKHHQPASAIQTTTFGPSKSTRKYVFPIRCPDSPGLGISWNIGELLLIAAGPTPPLSTPLPSATTAPTSARTPLPGPPLSARARSPSRLTSHQSPGVPRPRPPLLRRHRL